MTKIWVVTTGQYSDYSIHSLWSTKEKADAMKKILDRNKYSNAATFDMAIDEVKKEKAGFEVMIDLTTGEVASDHYLFHASEYPRPCVLIDGVPKCRIYNKGFNNKYLKQGGKWCVSVCEGRSSPLLIHSEHYSIDQAYKAARDFRAVELAKLEKL